MTLAAGIVTLLLAADERALVSEALEAATGAGLRTELLDVRLGVPAGCRASRVTVDEEARASGVIGLGVEGTSTQGRCAGRGWARVRVFGPAWVTTRAVRGGEPLVGAVQRVERERGSLSAPVADVERDAVAATSLSKGLTLEPRHVRGLGPAPGDRVVVVVETGDLRLEQDGVVLACARPCARLANGHRVEGELVDGKLKVTP